jgi:hypothetical protein
MIVRAHRSFLTAQFFVGSRTEGKSGVAITGLQKVA